MNSITYHYVGFYEGRARRENPNRRTALLLKSKYRHCEASRAEMVIEMRDVLLSNAVAFDVVTYCPSGNSGYAHARRLAELIAKASGRPLVAPSNFRKTSLAGKHVLIVDDVLKTGATIRRLALKLRENLPARVTAIVYLKAHEKGGKPIL